MPDQAQNTASARETVQRLALLLAERWCREVIETEGIFVGAGPRGALYGAISEIDGVRVRSLDDASADFKQAIYFLTQRGRCSTDSRAGWEHVELFGIIYLQRLIAKERGAAK